MIGQGASGSGSGSWHWIGTDRALRTGSTRGADGARVTRGTSGTNHASVYTITGRERSLHDRVVPRTVGTIPNIAGGVPGTGGIVSIMTRVVPSMAGIVAIRVGSRDTNPRCTPDAVLGFGMYVITPGHGPSPRSHRLWEDIGRGYSNSYAPALSAFVVKRTTVRPRKRVGHG